jgi:hypothetical protein
MLGHDPDDPALDVKALSIEQIKPRGDAYK